MFLDHLTRVTLGYIPLAGRKCTRHLRGKTLDHQPTFELHCGGCCYLGTHLAGRKCPGHLRVKPLDHQLTTELHSTLVSYKRGGTLLFYISAVPNLSLVGTGSCRHESPFLSEGLRPKDPARAGSCGQEESRPASDRQRALSHNRGIRGREAPGRGTQRWNLSEPRKTV